MRALLDLMRENGASVQADLLHFLNLLLRASKHFQILDPELGEEELVKSVAAEMANVEASIDRNSQRQ